MGGGGGSEPQGRASFPFPSMFAHPPWRNSRCASGHSHTYFVVPRHVAWVRSISAATGRWAFIGSCCKTNPGIEFFQQLYFVKTVTWLGNYRLIFKWPMTKYKGEKQGFGAVLFFEISAPAPRLKNLASGSSSPYFISTAWVGAKI